eukprot:918199-Pleurochrysis_carterae.AAC.2
MRTCRFASVCASDDFVQLSDCRRCAFTCPNTVAGLQPAQNRFGVDLQPYLLPTSHLLLFSPQPT